MSGLRRSLSTALCSAVLVTSACRSDAPPPLAVQGTSAPEAAATVAQPVAPRTSGPWFIEGPGAQAMALRARGDHTAALEVLARAKAKPGSADAAAIELLRADSAAAQKDAAGAAKAYAAARAHEDFAALAGPLKLLEAQARLDAGEPDTAVALLSGLEPGDGLGTHLWLVRADAALRTGEREAAVQDYKRYISKGDAARRHEARAKLARALGESGDGTAEREAAGLWARIVVEVPLSDFADEGRAYLKAGGGKRDCSAVPKNAPALDATKPSPHSRPA